MDIFSCQNYQVGPSEAKKYKYLVRFVNPDQKSQYVTKIWHNEHSKFKSISHLKQSLCESFEDKLNGSENFVCGYLDKASKRWIEDDQDLEAMYQLFKNRDCDVTLWCIAEKRGKKRKIEESEEAAPTKRASKEDQVDAMAMELREKHGEKYDFRQLQLWARMKLNGQHTSLEHPPCIPFFSGANVKPAKRESLSDALTSAATAVVGILKGKSDNLPTEGTMSPGKRAQVSGQYLEQLEKLLKLQESGALTASEFEEQKEITLANLKQLNA